MKRLALLRHASSGLADQEGRDFDRKLDEHGRRAARAIGAEMRAKGLSFELVVASPAARALETLAQAQAAYGEPLRPQLDPRLYLASADTLLDIVRETDDQMRSLLLVGHNPGLECLVQMLASDGDLSRKAGVQLATGTLAQLTLSAERWADVQEGSGTLLRILRPEGSGS